MVLNAIACFQKEKESNGAIFPFTVVNDVSVKNISLGFLNLMFFITYSCQNVANIITRLKNTPFHQTSSKTLVVLKAESTKEDLQDSFKNCWTEKYSNIAVIYEKSQLYTFTYNPFQNEADFLQNFTNKPAQTLFYNKFKDLNGRKLNTLLLKYDDRDKIILKKHPNGTLEWQGYEIRLLRCMISSMNGSLNIMPSDFYLKSGERNPWRPTSDLNFTGVETKKRLIQDYKIDIMNTDIMMLKEELKGVSDSLYPHFMDDMRIILTRPGRIPFYRYVVSVFNYQVWGAFIGAIGAGTLGWCVTGSGLYPKWHNKLINLLRITTGGSLPKLSPVNSERIFLIFWIFYTLIILTAFTSNLTTVLMQEKYYPNPDTLEELTEAGTVVYTWMSNLREFRKSFNGTSKMGLINRMKIFPDKYDHVNSSLNNLTELMYQIFTEKAGSTTGSGRAIYTTRHRIFKNMFHLVKESPLPNYMAFQIPADSPYTDPLNTILRRIIEAGLLGFWQKEQEHYYILNHHYFNPDEGEMNHTEAYPISLNHLQAAFLILFCGLGISVFAFMMEMFCYSFMQKLCVKPLIG